MLLKFTDAVYGKNLWIDHAHIAVVVDVEMPLQAGHDECIVHVAGGHADGWRLRHSADYVRKSVDEADLYPVDIIHERRIGDYAADTQELIP
jgi:hypothetical protein